MENQPIKRQKSVSVLRVIATIAVVFSHTYSTLLESVSEDVLSSIQYDFFDICSNVLKWHVPIFYMITGALLLKKDFISPKDCVCKYAKRMFIALLLFGIPFSLIIQFFEIQTFNVSMLWKSILMTLSNQSFGHLWYLFTIIGVYLMLPAIKGIVVNCEKNVQKYILVVLYLCCFVIPFVNTVFDISLAFNVPIGGNVLFYLLLGYYISNLDVEKLKKYRKFAVFCIILCVLVIVLFNYLFDTANVVMSYNSPVNVIFTLSVYVIVSSAIYGETGKKLWLFDRLCFGVYLIHPVFIQFLYRFLKITPVSFEQWVIMTIIFSIGFTAIAFTCSWVMSKIKPLKKYIL